MPIVKRTSHQVLTAGLGRQEALVLLSAVAEQTQAVAARAYVTATTIASGIAAAVVATPDSAMVDAYGSGGPATLTTAAVTVSASGGTAPYTFAWSRLSGTALNLSGASSASTTFSRAVAAGAIITARYRCVATDAVGSAGVAEVDVTLDNT